MWSEEEIAMTQENLKVWYKGNEFTIENRLKDASGNSNHAKVYGGVSIKEESLYLSQQEQGHIILPKGTLEGCNHLTISAWIKPTTLDAWARLFDFGDDRKKNIFFAVNSNVANSNGGRPVLSLTHGNVHQVHSKADLISGKWQHVAIIIEESIATIYLNGVETGRNEQVNIQPSIYTDGFNYIGKSHFDVDPYYNGHIQDFRVYDKALPVEMLREIMLEKMTDEEAVDTVLEALDIPGKDMIKENIILPQTFLPGVELTWISSDENVIKKDGTVIQKAESNQKVILRATVQKGEITKERVFELSVLQQGMPSYFIHVDGDKKGVTISDTFVGIFFEDINYGADGGLYGELINNRSFEFGSFKDTLSKFDDYFYGWSIQQKGEANLSHQLKSETPIHENNPHYLEVTIHNEGEGAKLCNSGFDGIAVKQGARYNFSVFLKNHSYQGKINLLLQGRDGTLYGKEVLDIDLLDSTWKCFESTLTSDVTDAEAIFVLQFEGIGVLDIDMVSLFPEDTWANRKNGLRQDLVQSLKDLQPKFIRFPGGCIVEGKYLTNAYNWKHTIGPVETRKVNWNRWEEGNPYPYNQSCGLGFYEYFQLAKDIGATPLPVVNCGMSCQFQGSEIAEDIEPYIQDALDLIEYANGDKDTVWGARRIADGHKEPFNLIYLGIGNEQWVDYDKHVKDKYFIIYELFRNRIKEKYPNIELITTSGPFPDGKEFDIAWDIINKKTEAYMTEGKVYAELVDEHYYMSPEWFLENDNRYDTYPRYEDGKSAKVFAGEYACHTNGGPSKQGNNNLMAAICEAAFMIGLERNSDVVAMTTYAPLFAKTTNVQWQPDLIWFNNTDVYFSPSYYVQKMFGNNMGTYTLHTETVANSEVKADNHLPIYALASYDEVTGEKILKLVNASKTPQDVAIQITNGTTYEVVGTLLTSTYPDDQNTLENPTKVKTKEIEIGKVEKDFSYTLPAYSFVVLRLKK